MKHETPLHQARGAGASHTGTRHFWDQRLTAVALLPLTVWFVYVTASLTGASHDQVVAILADPVQAGLMLFFILVGLFHMVLGLEVVIDDYIARPALKYFLLFLNMMFGLGVGIASVLAVLKLVL